MFDQNWAEKLPSNFIIYKGHIIVFLRRDGMHGVYKRPKGRPRKNVATSRIGETVALARDEATARAIIDREVALKAKRKYQDDEVVRHVKRPKLRDRVDAIEKRIAELTKS